MLKTSKVNLYLEYQLYVEQNNVRNQYAADSLPPLCVSVPMGISVHPSTPVAISGDCHCTPPPSPHN